MQNTGSLPSFLIDFDLFSRPAASVPSTRPRTCGQRTAPVKEKAKDQPSPLYKPVPHARKSLSSRPVTAKRPELRQSVVDKVKGELRTKHNHYLLSSLKRQTLEVEKSKPGSQTVTESRFKQFSNAVMHIQKGLPEPVEIQKRESSTVLMMPSEMCTKKLYDQSCSGWLRKRGRGASADPELMKFANAYFECLDSQEQGWFDGKTLLVSLLGLGVATDANVLKKTLLLIYKKNDLKLMKIDLDAFRYLFKADVMTDHILKVLNSSSLLERQNKGITNQGVITISEHQELIQKWWAHIRAHSKHSGLVNSIGRKLAEIGIVSDANQGVHFLYNTLGVTRKISFDKFQQLFARSILKGALLNLSKRLSSGKFSSKLLSTAFQISSYQRALILSGMKCPNSDISVEEGQNTLNVLTSVQDKHNIPYEDLKGKMLGLAGVSYIEALRRSQVIKEQVQAKNRKEEKEKPIIKEIEPILVEEYDEVTLLPHVDTEEAKEEESIAEEKFEEEEKEPDFEFKEISSKGSKCRFFVTTSRPLSSTRSGLRTVESFFANPEANYEE